MVSEKTKDTFIVIVAVLGSIAFSLWILTLLAGVTLGVLLGLIIIIGGIIAVAYYKRAAVKKEIKKPTSHLENLKNVALYYLEKGFPFPASYSEYEDRLTNWPKLDISTNVGNYHYFCSFADIDMNVRRNILFDMIEKKPVMEITGKIMPFDKFDALMTATQIAETIESGRVMERPLTPAVIREVIKEREESKEP